MSTDDDEDCPFIYREGEEPAPITHAVIGICVHCSGLAYTMDAYNRPACFPCAYDTAN